MSKSELKKGHSNTDRARSEKSWPQHTGQGRGPAVGVHNEYDQRGMAMHNPGHGFGNMNQKEAHAEHKTQSRKKLAELKAMPKPNLTKEEPSNDSTIAMSEDANCRYCEALSKVNDPNKGECPYCLDLQNNSPKESCKYCADMAQDVECKYCAQSAAQEPIVENPSVQNPTTTDSENFAGQDLNPPIIPKPIPGEDVQGQVSPSDDSTVNNENIQSPTEEAVIVTSQLPESVQVDQSKEAMMAIASQIEDTNSSGNGPGPQGQEAVQNTDDADLVSGSNMEDNFSRPEGFGQDDDGDMGIAQNPQSDGQQDGGEPDLTSVLHEGLDAHAENINREKVIQMVSQALEGFKASKQIIERAQEQAPQLYSASIMMLKAMIEMAKMLGLDQEGAPAPDGNPLEGQPQSEWEQPFATHPDQGGTSQPGHAPAAGEAAPQANAGSEWNNPFPTHPDNDVNIGQAVGKLPTSATTEHVARVPLAPGAVNALGQMKYVDPNTGKESFINMKEGRVLSPTGKPVKPQQG